MIKNCFFQHRKITETALIQRGTITWTIDSKDRPTDESMNIFCESLSENQRVNWEIEDGSGWIKGMIRVTFSIEAWVKPAPPAMPFQVERNRQPKP